MAVEISTRGGVAVIALNHPPVNGLGHAVRAGIVAALTAATRDDSIRVIVISGGARVFSGGADITEFNTPKATQAPVLRDVITALESCPKPVIAAINKLALGGGLELALGAHYRVATRDAQLGLPEVKLGLMPGAGGTQRLPRAIGIEKALTAIVSGEFLRAADWENTPLLDALTDGDATEAALAFAVRVAERTEPHPCLRLRPIPPLEDGKVAACFAQMRVRLAETAAHYPAPHRCVEAIERGFAHGFDAGLRCEREGFLELMATPESHALRHAFFAERAAAKAAGMAEKKPLIEARMTRRWHRQALDLVSERASSAAIDSALERFGFPRGPFGSGEIPAAELDEARHRHMASPGGRAPDSDEIVERMVFALVDEGARLLEEGLVDSAAQIDALLLANLGFPRWLGGPMFHADMVGLARVLATLERFGRPADSGTGAHPAWRPASLLQKLATEGEGGRFT